MTLPHIQLAHIHAGQSLQSGQGAPKWRHHSRLRVYLGPSPSHARSVALVLNPHMGYVSPQFLVRFDDFFEMVQEKPTDHDAPELEWKYLSGFTVWKGPAKSGIKGAMDNLLAPWREPIMTTMIPSSSIEPVQPANQQQDLPVPVVDDDIAMNLPTLPLPAHQTVPQLPQPLLDQPSPGAHQTHSGRVICNTPCYKQSISQRSQGLVAWEILLDQDEQEC